MLIYSEERMREILEISRTSSYRFIKESKGKGYIAVVNNQSTRKEEFYLSPLYVLNGQGISVELYLHFAGIKEIEEALTDNDKEVIKSHLGKAVLMKND